MSFLMNTGLGLSMAMGEDENLWESFLHCFVVALSIVLSLRMPMHYIPPRSIWDSWLVNIKEISMVSM